MLVPLTLLIWRFNTLTPTHTHKKTKQSPNPNPTDLCAWWCGWPSWSCPAGTPEGCCPSSLRSAAGGRHGWRWTAWTPSSGPGWKDHLSSAWSWTTHVAFRGGGSSIGIQRRTKIQWPRQEHKKNLWVFLSQKMLCRFAVCTCTHKNDHVCAHVKDPEVHVRVRWITEARKDPACTKKWQNNQPVDSVVSHFQPTKGEHTALYFTKTGLNKYNINSAYISTSSHTENIHNYQKSNNKNNAVHITQIAHARISRD